MEEKKEPIQVFLVDRIQGVELTRRTDLKKSIVAVRYIDQKHVECSLQMALSDALYLLNNLEAMSRDGGFENLRRPQPGSA